MPEPQFEASLTREGQQAETMESTINDANQRIAELECQLTTERAQSAHLRHMLEEVRHSTATILNTCEQAQEGITNRLIKEISRLRALQLSMCESVEAEESRLVGVLEERLRTLRAEKCDLENALEQEQERIVNRLTRQMDELRLLAGINNTNTNNGGSKDNGNNDYKSSTSLTSGAANAVEWTWKEKEADLHRQIARLQEENQNLLWKNMQLQNRLRRYSIEDSPLVEPLATPLGHISPATSASLSMLPFPPLRRSDSVSSAGGGGNGGGNFESSSSNTSPALGATHCNNNHGNSKSRSKSGSIADLVHFHQNSSPNSNSNPNQSQNQNQSHNN